MRGKGEPVIRRRKKPAPAAGSMRSTRLPRELLRVSMEGGREGVWRGRGKGAPQRGAPFGSHRSESDGACVRSRSLAPPLPFALSLAVAPSPSLPQPSRALALSSPALSPSRPPSRLRACARSPPLSPALSRARSPSERSPRGALSESTPHRALTPRCRRAVPGRASSVASSACASQATPPPGRCCRPIPRDCS